MASNQGTAARAGSHVLLLHHTETQRRSGVLAWVRRGLRVGAKLIYTEPADAEDRSLGTLVEAQPEAQEALERGQVEILQADVRTYDPDWQLRKVQDALDGGYPAVHWSAEASTAWSVMSRVEHLELERNADALCRSIPLSFMCQYSAQESERMLPTLCATHTSGVVDPLLRVLHDGDDVVLAGEVDPSNRDTVASFLDVTTSGRPADPLVVDLSDLDFLDVSGVRALMTGTNRFRSRGGSVRLRDPRRHVERIGRLVLCTPAHGFTVEPA